MKKILVLAIVLMFSAGAAMAYPENAVQDQASEHAQAMKEKAAEKQEAAQEKAQEKQEKALEKKEKAKEKTKSAPKKGGAMLMGC